MCSLIVGLDVLSFVMAAFVMCWGSTWLSWGEVFLPTFVYRALCHKVIIAKGYVRFVSPDKQ